MSSSEKRENARAHSAVCAWLSFQDDPAAYGSMAEDLSSEGAGFTLMRPVGVGERLTVALDLDQQRVKCRGSVCWSESTDQGEGRFGVHFDEIGEHARDQLMRFTGQVFDLVNEQSASPE